MLLRRLLAVLTLMAVPVVSHAGLGCPRSTPSEPGQDWLVTIYCNPVYGAACPSGGVLQTELLTESQAATLADGIAEHGCWASSTAPSCCYLTRPSGAGAKIPPASVGGLVLGVVDLKATTAAPAGDGVK